MDFNIDKLKKDFGVTEDLSEIQFIQIVKENYKNAVQENAFGEKLCTLYTIHFRIYNLEYSMKILVFIYETSCEVLKLDLRLQEPDAELEITQCKNFLQRHRNLNATFVALKKFSRFYESRRLIKNIVLKKEPRITFHKNDEGAMCIKYNCVSPDIYIEICWKIEWTLKDCDISDMIEVYYNNFNLPNSEFIKQQLEVLTHNALDFHIKLRLWKQLLSDLSKHTRYLQATVIISDEPSDQAENILVISDSEDDRNQTEEMRHKRKRQKVVNNVSSQIIHVAD
ncbi:uncharacterized protein LOC114327528 [Diabrotica virgifera virgifera]|uniref:Uncharacterized protein LOC114327528 n=1 Tax=Diabrotica virgifera virgifera TaxID=50390 RepID=A0A6P7FFH3_DIAVI|nr:uncharacterized protein LOC114327528 [Diabrotica virgifera virgifera]